MPTTPRMKLTDEKPAAKTRPPMDRMRAAYQCDRILSQLPPEERALVVEFIRTPRQTNIPGVGNA